MRKARGPFKGSARRRFVRLQAVEHFKITTTATTPRTIRVQQVHVPVSGFELDAGAADRLTAVIAPISSLT